MILLFYIKPALMRKSSFGGYSCTTITYQFVCWGGCYWSNLHEIINWQSVNSFTKAMSHVSVSHVLGKLIKQLKHKTSFLMASTGSN